MKNPTLATVVFLKNKEGKICLARKKKAIHHEGGEISYSLGTYNGYGGKKDEEDVSIEDTAIREANEESGIKSKKEDLKYCGKIFFFWPNNKDKISADMEVSFYFLENWEDEPKEGKEMGVPEFFDVENIPYDEMMNGDKLILPKMFAGEFIEGNLFLGESRFEELKIEGEILKLK